LDATRSEYQLLPEALVDESTEAEVADEESKIEETADATPAAPTKSKNKKNKNK
jgi:hypothetical protein